MYYIAIIHKDPDSDFGVTFPDIPGCFSAGSTMDEAQSMAQEALEGHLELLLDRGGDLPKPSSLETIMADPDYADGAAILVPYTPTQKKVYKRINLTVRDDILAEIDTLAGQAGKSRSAYMVDAALQHMR